MDANKIIFITFVATFALVILVMFWERHLLKRGLILSDFKDANIRNTASKLHDAIMSAVQANRIYNLKEKERSYDISLIADCISNPLLGMMIVVFIEESRLVPDARGGYYHPQHLVIEVKMRRSGKITVKLQQDFITWKGGKYRPDEIEEVIENIAAYVKNYCFFTNIYRH